MPKAEQHRRRGPQFLDLLGFSIRRVIAGGGSEDDDDSASDIDMACCGFRASGDVKSLLLSLGGRFFAQSIKNQVSTTRLAGVRLTRYCIDVTRSWFLWEEVKRRDVGPKSINTTTSS